MIVDFELDQVQLDQGVDQSTCLGKLGGVLLDVGCREDHRRTPTLYAPRNRAVDGHAGGIELLERELVPDEARERLIRRFLDRSPSR